MLSMTKVIKPYKKVEKSEEKIFRRGDYRADLGLFKGVWGCFIKKYYKHRWFI